MLNNLSTSAVVPGRQKIDTTLFETTVEPESDCEREVRESERSTRSRVQYTIMLIQGNRYELPCYLVVDES